MIRAVLALALPVLLAFAAPAAADEPLVLEAKIPLGRVFGRIDHMAIDVRRQRLFVAELGNDSLGVVDLKTASVVKRLPHMAEPQGTGYVAATDTVYVASGLDGMVRLFHGADLAPAGMIALGQDADDIRVDDKAGQVVVGYGAGGIAVIDAATGKLHGTIHLAEHPEGFALWRDRIFVNVPDARQIAVIDRAAQKQVASWPTHDGRANFPLAIEGEGERVVSVFRRPARLVAFSPVDGRSLASIDTCADADDVFADAKRHRLYVSCGEGAVDVLERRGNTYRRLARVPTAPGARTSLFVPELDRLYVAVRAVTGAANPAAKGAAPTPSAPAGLTPPAIWVFRPVP
jgi:DNA-binding beta-propeller fold protein YncE